MHQRVPETEVSAVMRLVYGGLHSLKEYAGKRVARSILRIMPPLTATPIPDSLATRAAKAPKKKSSKESTQPGIILGGRRVFFRADFAWVTHFQHGSAPCKNRRSL